ncbi:MAG: hypothetical protein ACR2F5_02280 [Candidatus Limnocylindria bacterium]
MNAETEVRALENALRRTMAFPMETASRAVTDGYVQRALVAEATRRASLARRPLILRSRGFLAGAVAAALVVSTVAASGSIYEAMTGGSPMLEAAWQNADVIDQSVEDAGVTVVLERAGIESDRFWVALTATADGDEPPDIGLMELVDVNGTVMSGGTALGSGDLAGSSATLFGFTIPAEVTPQGPFTLAITSVTTTEISAVNTAEHIPGDWTFTFDLEQQP